MKPGHESSLLCCKRDELVVAEPQEQADRSQRAAKYAAVLGLAAVDPVVAHQNASFRFLSEYVRRRRYDKPCLPARRQMLTAPR